MKNNKLIAEFMGLSMLAKEVYTRLNEQTGTTDFLEAKELRYEKSWDWLMPVVQKCYKIDNEDGFDNLVDAVSTLDIDGTYKAVVEFINQTK